MATVIPFFDKANHQVEKLRENFPSQPRRAAMKLALWSAGKALSGNILSPLRQIQGGRQQIVKIQSVLFFQPFLVIGKCILLNL